MGKEKMILFVACLCGIHILLMSTYAESRRIGKEARRFNPKECKADEEEEWSYHGRRNGVKYWGKINAACNGKSQSPIAIKSKHAISSPDHTKLEMKNYDKPVTKARVVNNGHTVEVTPTDGVTRSIVVDGSTYNLAQFHFHWGDKFNRGAEHTLDGVQYSMELHLVHQNKDQKIAVIGVLYFEQTHKNEELQKLVDLLPEVVFKDMSTELQEKVDLTKLLPADPKSFYRYIGSLTTPGCTEGVIWSVMAKPLPIGKTQMNTFRTLYSSTKEEASPACKLINNYRPVQSLNRRKVYVSH